MNDFEFSWDLSEHEKHKEVREKVTNERDKLLTAVTQISRCPILAANKNDMYNEKSSELFFKSTVRRMEIAHNILQELKK
jgi:hypothetical protein